MKKNSTSGDAWFDANVGGDLTSITMLIQQARDGSEDARAKVLRKLQPFVISMAAQHKQHSVQNKQGVSDIVQQSFVKVIENFESFRGSSSAEFRGWLKQLVINEIRQINRNLHRQCRDVKREKSLEQASPNRHEDVAKVDATPAAIAIVNEQVARLKIVLEDLDDFQKSVIELRAFENLTFREIAKRLDSSQDAVTKVWYRGLIQLQKRLTEDDS